MKEKRIGYLTVIRGASCVAVVLLHTFFLAANTFQPSPGAYTGSMMVRNALLWAVPCFVMVSGALLLDPGRELPFRKLFRNYIGKTLLVLFLCTLVFTLVDAFTHKEPTGLAILTDWLYKVLTNGSWLHLWYLYLLLALYLMLPAYRALVRSVTAEEYRYLLLVLLIFQSVFPTIGYITGVTNAFYICVYTVYPLYFFAGYALRRGLLRIKRPAAAGLFFGNTVAILLCTWFGQTTGNELLLSLGNSYASVFVVFQALGLFSLLQTAEDREAPRVLRSLDSASYGIFLWHILVLKIIYQWIGFDPYPYGGLLMVAAVAFLTVLVLWPVVAIIKKAANMVKNR